MTIDTYAICPCGSGKKIKFCKCKDSVHELDRVLKMIEGGQLVPALDRLASILEEHPDAAWALAIRGRLLMDLREYQSLEENAQRFTRLQPSNPLALTQRAAAALFRQDFDAATGLILEALTESGQTVDSFVLDVVSLLAYALAGNGVPLTARVYATLALVSNGYEDNRLAADVLEQLNRDPKINQLAKVVPELIARPTGADWGERYDEAASLLANNKVVLAQTKFESLQRSAPQQPAVLSGLLNCAIWRGDHVAQADLLAKLAQCEDLSFEDRARYLAMSLVVSPEANRLGVPMVHLTGEFEAIDEPQMALAADDHFAAIPADALASFKEETGITPRAGFQILDRPAPDAGTPLTVETAPLGVGLALLYGRETDRPARIDIVGASAYQEAELSQRMQSVATGGQWKSESDHVVSLVEYATPHLAGVQPEQVQSINFDALQRDLFQTHALKTILETPVALLGDVSLRDAAGDESERLPRAAMLRYLEGEDSFNSRDETLIGSLYGAAEVDAPAAIHPTAEQIELIPNYDLDRIDPSGLDAEHLVYLIQRAMQVSASRLGRRASKALLEMDLPEDSPLRDSKIAAYSFLMQRAANSDESMEYLEQAKAFCEQRSLPNGSLLLTELMLRARRGEPEAFQACAQAIVQQHGQDAEIMGQFQQILMQLGLIRPDGSMPRAPAAATGPAAAGDAGSGLWTPESGSPAASPAGGGGGGGGKLWVPGMD